jgi:hypothetical protein
MKAPWTDPGLRELFALSMLASFGCGLALAVNDLLFAAIFAAAIAVTISGGNAPITLTRLGVLIIFSLGGVNLLTVHPRNLLGKQEPGARHFFECPLR